MIKLEFKTRGKIIARYEIFSNRTLGHPNAGISIEIDPQQCVE